MTATIGKTENPTFSFHGVLLRALALLLLATPVFLHAAPSITSINPSSVAAGGPGFQMNIFGNSFLPQDVVLVNGVSRGNGFQLVSLFAVTITPADIAAAGTVSIAIFDPFTSTLSNTVFLTVTGAPAPAGPLPVLNSVTPAALSQGTAGVQMTFTGSNFRPGARITFGPQSSAGTLRGVTVDSATVINSGLITASVTVSATGQPGTLIFNVVNADQTTTASNGTSRVVNISTQSALGAPLSVTALALTGPRNGALVSAGSDLFGEAILAGSGSGTVTGVWLWDGAVTEQFTTVLAGGNRATLRSRQSFPTTLLGVHTLELRVLQPNAIASRPLTVVVSPRDFQTERILAPEFNAFAPTSAPPTLRWAPVPGAAKYQVGFSAQPYFNTITTWYDVNNNDWPVPAAVWASLPEGQIYWTFRAVEMSGSAHKPVPMRPLSRFPSGALSPVASRPISTSEGGLIVDWQPLKSAYRYRVTVSEDAAGAVVLHRYITADSQADLQSLLPGMAPGKTYYWRVEALDQDGRSVFTGPAQSFEAPSGGGQAGPRTLQQQPLALSLRNVSHSVSAPAAVPAVEIRSLINRSPAPDSTVTDVKTTVVAEFSQLAPRARVTISIDGMDVSSLAKLDGAKLSYAPAFPLANGQHAVTVTLGGESSSWKFSVKAPRNLIAAAAPRRGPGNDSESRPPSAPPTATAQQPGAPPAQQGAPAVISGTQMQSQIGVTTQWVSGAAADTSSITFGEQMSLQQGNWTTQANGTGLLNSTFNPEPQRHSLGSVNNYVVQTGYQNGRNAMQIRFGVLAPSLYRNSQLVTPATPRQGAEFNLQTVAGGVGFYANTNDVAPGAGSGAAFHQQLLGASWDLPVPKKYAEFRVMWLSAKDSGSAAPVTTSILGQNLTAAGNLTTAGGGDLYGGLLVVHLPHQWSWISEYGWGYNSLNLGASPHHTFGRAWQSGVTGAVKTAVVNVTYFDTGVNFTSPANPALSAGSIPDRSGVNASLTLPTRLGTFILGDQFARSNVNSATAVEQSMNAVTEGWSKQIGLKTVLGASVHETLTGFGAVPASLQTLPPETLRLLEADQRDLGAALTATRQVGKASLTLSTSRDWNRNNLNPLADLITSSVLTGANWAYNSFFQINSTFGVNWTAAEKINVGTTRALTGHFQPAFTLARPGIQVAPIVSFNESRTQLLGGTLTNNLNTGQYGGRITWTMPGDFKFSSLAFEGDLNHNKNILTGADLSDKSLFLVWTLTWNRQRGAQ